MLISEEYRELNRALHETRKDYGSSGHRWADMIQHLVHENACLSALDYGCGKQTLAKALNHPRWLRGYDPAIEGLDERPQAADVVICGDVLEHIEPDCLDEVLDDIAHLARKLVFLVVATRPAVKTLADGRNAHLIVEAPSWWLDRIMARFELLHFTDMGGEFVAVARASGSGADEAE